MKWQFLFAHRFFNWTQSYRRNFVDDFAARAGCALCELAYRRPTLPPLDLRDHWNESECIRDYGTQLLAQSDEWRRAGSAMVTFVGAAEAQD